MNQGNSDCSNRVVETVQATVTCTVDVLCSVFLIIVFSGYIFSSLINYQGLVTV